MICREFADGGVVFDPHDGRTYFYPTDAIETLKAISQLIRPGTQDVESLTRAAIAAIGDRSLRESPDEQVDATSHLRHWSALALRLNDY